MRRPQSGRSVVIMLCQSFSHAVCVDELAYAITSCAPVARLMHIDKGLKEQVADADEALSGTASGGR